MTAWNYICLALSLAFFAAVFWPAIYGATGRAVGWVKTAFHSRSDDSGTVALAAGGVVTAEQAQAAELILSRFLSKADRSDPTYKLIANGIKTLAEQTT